VQVTWHNREFLFPLTYRYFSRPSQLDCLVSPSRDGDWLCLWLGSLGYETIRGSSSRRGAIAFRQALASLSRGRQVVITPDGPSGPLYEVKPGVIRLARLSGAPLTLVVPKVHRTIRLGTWDGLYVPLTRRPATAVLRFRNLADLVGEEPRRDREKLYADILRQQLLRLTDDRPWPTRTRRPPPRERCHPPPVV
jgi:hypothetical protein